MKKTIAMILAALLCLAMAACGAQPSAPAAVDPAAYSADEEAGIAAFGEDLVTVTDETFPETVTELIAHAGAFDGTPYRMQGVYKLVNGTPCLTRVLRANGEENEIALPLSLLLKDYTDGDWIEVVGIAASGGENGETQTVLDVIAVKSLAQSGAAVLDWDGRSHTHDH